MQRVSTKLSAVEQLQLIPQPSVVSRPVSFDRIYTLTDTHDALMYACELGKKVPKQAYEPMGIDKTTWSRICGGEWDLDGRDILKFDRIVGNDAYLLYLNHLHGYDLASMRKAQDDKDRRIAELEAQVAERDKRIETIIEYERQKDGRK